MVASFYPRMEQSPQFGAANPSALMAVQVSFSIPVIRYLHLQPDPAIGSVVSCARQNSFSLTLVSTKKATLLRGRSLGGSLGVPSRGGINIEPNSVRRPLQQLRAEMSSAGNASSGAPMIEDRNFAAEWGDLCLASPDLLSARALTDDATVITSSWSVRDVASAKKRAFSAMFTRMPSDATATPSYFGAPPTPAVGFDQFISPSGKRVVRFSEGNGGDEICVEVWSGGGEKGGGNCLDAAWTVPESVHGLIFADEWFGGVAWSPDENMFVYIADRPRRLGEGGGEPKKGSSESSSNRSKWMESLRKKYDQTSRDVLGELFVKRSSPALFLADVVQRQSKAMCNPSPDSLMDMDEKKDMFGDPQWSANGRWIAVVRRPTALSEESLEDDGLADNAHNLGLKYCYNRYSSVELFRAPTSLEDGGTVIESMVPVTNHTDKDEYCCTSPRFTPDSNHLVYLSAPRTTEGRAKSSCLPHDTTKILRMAEVFQLDEPASSSAPETVVHVVHTVASEDEFPGLYLHSLPQRPWFGTGKNVELILSSVWGSERRCLRIPVGTAMRVVPPTSIVDVTPTFPGCSSAVCVSVLDVSANGTALLQASTPTLPNQLALMDLTKPRSSAVFVSRPSEKARIFDSKVLPFQSVDLALSEVAESPVDATVAAHEYRKGVDKPTQRYQTTLLLPEVSRSGSVPLIVFPHGGPHAVSLNLFNRGIAAMLLADMAVLQVNYRGSQGCGQACLETLPGFAGTQDVAEVLQATQWALQSFPQALDKNRVGYTGGSHGGFLGAHVSVVPGNLFKAVVLRNPVTNISSMVNVSDIPEWAFCEAGVEATNAQTGLSLCPDPAAMAKMWCASPVARVSKTGTRPGKTLLLVGAQDRRVPPQQSIEWQRIITEAFGAGIVTLRWYPESSHPIQEVPHGDDAWVHTLEIFSEL